MDAKIKTTMFALSLLLAAGPACAQDAGAYVAAGAYASGYRPQGAPGGDEYGGVPHPRYGDAGAFSGAPYGYATYGGEPGLSWSTAERIGYAPVDAYGLSGDAGPDYVTPPDHLTEAVRSISAAPLYYDGYRTYGYGAGGPVLGPQRTAYVERDSETVSRTVRRQTRLRRAYAPLRRYGHYHRYRLHRSFAAIDRHDEGYRGYDRDDLPVATRIERRCVDTDFGKIDCSLSRY